MTRPPQGGPADKGNTGAVVPQTHRRPDARHHKPRQNNLAPENLASP
ncbi:hypothetical protein ACF1CG_12335 [Streptomyces sp. NPDC014773]